METKILINELETNAIRIQSLATVSSDTQARWKPSPTDWSILEVVNHLYDEERLDFRVRLDIILHRSEEKLPPIDPAGWVAEHGYMEKEISSSIKNFMRERQDSLDWLRSLKDPSWQASHPVPWGTISAGDMFAAWVTHDTLHMRQLVELHHSDILNAASPFDTQYAGDW